MNDLDIDRLVESVAARYKRINTYFLNLAGNRIKEIGDLRPTELHRLEIALTVEKDLEQIIGALSDASGKSQKEIYNLLKRSASEDYDFAKQFYECRSIKPPAMTDNTAIMNMVEAVYRQTGGAVSNLSLTTALGMKAGNSAKEYLSLADSYKHLMDQAITAVQSGVIDYNTAMRNILKSFSDSGIRSIEYESGYSRRIDSAVRMNLLDGVRQINQRMQDIVGEQFGADGVEISAHFSCAEDHLPYQGRQYSNEDFIRLQDSLKRPFGQWNCRHKRFAIILGVSKPVYSDEELEAIKIYNRRMIDFDGQKLNIMQVRQLQSGIASEMIKQQDRLTLFKASGDELGALEAQDRITQLNNKLVKLDKAVKDVDNALKSPFCIASDITSEFIDKTTPRSGAVTFEDNYSIPKHKNEVRTANWLFDNFGGRIRLLSESSEVGVKRADFEWNGKLWDLKNVTTVKAVDSAVRHGLKQIFDNPGGIILDFNDNEILLSEVEKALEDRINRSGKKGADVIIVQHKKVIKILRYKK